ncbi:MAG: 5-oxopent-3-ene,2,5-tricarboxylate decarboxylase [Caulobacteraceae bacterium]|nr:5-oxopent-3-ene,2,5-tricarboxylate decarboxylase [Caulobacteraceae bacterium]
MIAGTAYGVALNDRRQLERMSAAFAEAPYRAPPAAPVLYIKPRTSFGTGGAPVPLPADLEQIEAAATVGLLFARDLTGAAPDEVRAAVGAACLALDVSEPHDNYYRPAIRERCRDGFLPLGRFAALPQDLGEIVTRIDGREVHRWSLDRLVRPLEALCAELSGFMTLRAGDLLLVGLPGDAPRARRGQSIAVRAEGLPALDTVVVAGDLS